MTLPLFSYDRSIWSPSFSSIIFQNFPSISDLLSQVTKLQHHRKLCSKCSTSIDPSSSFQPSLQVKRIFFWLYCFTVNPQTDTLTNSHKVRPSDPPIIFPPPSLRAQYLSQHDDRSWPLINYLAYRVCHKQPYWRNACHGSFTYPWATFSLSTFSLDDFPSSKLSMHDRLRL